MQAELLWWEGCPSTGEAHALLREALAGAGLDPGAVELREIRTEADARRENFTGSPTIRIGGVEVAPATGEAPSLTCRVYRLRDGRPSPLPDRDDIKQAIGEALT